MGKYIHKFTNVTDFNNSYTGQDYLEPWVSLTKQPSITIDAGATFYLTDATDYTVDGTSGYYWSFFQGNTRYEYGVVTKTQSPGISDISYPLSSYATKNAYEADGGAATTIVDSIIAKNIAYNKVAGGGAIL